MTRIETGRVQFGEEEPGIYVRGREAAAYALALKNSEVWLAKSRVLEILRDLFGQALIAETDEKIQKLRPTDECQTYRSPVV